MAIWGDDRKNKEMADEVVAGISATIADSITKTMQPVFEELAGEIRTALADSREQQDKAAADMAASIRGMQQLMESFNASMQSMQKIADSQQAILARLSEVQRAQAETQKSLTQECESAFTGVRDTQNKLAALYDDIGKGATALVAREEGIVKNQKAVLDKAGEDLIALQGRWTENFNRANTTLTDNYDRMFKQMGTTVEALSDYSAKLAEANESMKAGFNGFTGNMEKAVTDTFAIIDKQLGEAVDILSRTTEEVNEAAARLPKAIRGLA